jgi:Heterokaryon incompatibility protein (HET)
MELPQTIVDAISVCRAVGISYLRVDIMYIDQSDPEDMQHQINHMDQIYSFATATIIVASSADEEESHYDRG